MDTDISSRLLHEIFWYQSEKLPMQGNSAHCVYGPLPYGLVTPTAKVGRCKGPTGNELCREPLGQSCVPAFNTCKNCCVTQRWCANKHASFSAQDRHKPHVIHLHQVVWTRGASLVEAANVACELRSTVCRSSSKAGRLPGVTHNDA